MIDLIELPYRGYGTSNSLSTELSMTLQVGKLQFTRTFGRKIDLEPFASGKIFKYKTIQLNDHIVERTFLLSKHIEPDEEWWKDEDLYIYPIQCKFIERGNAIFGKSFKYAFGITDYLRDHQAEFCYPVMEDEMSRFQSAWMRQATQALIPSPDLSLAVSYKSDGFSKFAGYRDDWMYNDPNLAHIFRNIRTIDIEHNGLISLAQTDETVQSAHCIDADPIDKSWLFYEFAMFINDLAISDLTITAYQKKSKLDISFGSRYNIDCSKDPGVQELTDILHNIVFNVLQEKFQDTPWTKIVIYKTWSEELYFFVYEKQSPKEVSQVLYLDLVLFSLGTVGIKQQ